MEKTNRITRFSIFFLGILIFSACTTGYGEFSSIWAYRPDFPREDAQKIKILLVSEGKDNAYFSYNEKTAPSQKEVFDEPFEVADLDTYGLNPEKPFDLPEPIAPISLFPFSNNVIFASFYQNKNVLAFYPETQSLSKPAFIEYRKYKNKLRNIKNNPKTLSSGQFLKVHAPMISFRRGVLHFLVYADFGKVESGQQNYFRIISEVSHLKRSPEEKDIDFIHRGIRKAERILFQRIFTK